MRFSIFVCVAVVVTLAIAPIGAMAQENTTNATDELEEELTDEEIVERIDPTLAITDWQFSDDTFTLTLNADESQDIVVAEAIRADEGTGRMTWDVYDLDEGEQTIDIPVRSARNGKAAISIASDRSRAAGHATYVSSGMIQPDREPVSYQAAQLMVIFSAIGGAGLAFRVVRNRRKSNNERSERII